MSDNDLIQKGQDDLIRRGDVRELLQQCGLMGTHQSDPLAVMFNEIPAVQPTVKPLVWRTYQDKYDGGRVHYGTGAFGHWYCVNRRKSGVWDIVHHVDGKPIHLEPCDTLDAAKAAAQSDYEARILSALDMQPTVSPELLATTHDVAALMEALESAVKWVDQYRWAAPWVDQASAALARVKGVM